MRRRTGLRRNRRSQSRTGPARPGRAGPLPAAGTVPAPLVVRLARRTTAPAWLGADAAVRSGRRRDGASGTEAAGRSRRRRLRGQLWHAWFAQVSWLEDRLPDEARLRRAAAELLADVPGGPGDLAADLADFHAALRRPAVAELLTRDRYRDLRQLSLPAKVQRDLAGSSFSTRGSRTSGASQSATASSC